jgi:ring-1,2-phenylacetyl-CoA epoxidase subunit PaaD
MVMSSSDQAAQGELEKKIWNALGDVKDPEIPTLSLLDLNIIRGVRFDETSVTVLMTPTFAGCPALNQMKNDIIERLTRLECGPINVETVLSNAWSTDLLSSEAREKLRAFGIAPPPLKRATLRDTLNLPVPCPFCGSTETRLESSFGATLCKQLYYCNHCSQSFERFKPL